MSTSLPQEQPQRQPQRQLIDRNGNRIPIVPPPQVPEKQPTKDLVPMIDDIRGMVEKCTDSMTQQIAQAVKLVEKRGGEGLLSKAIIIRRDEIIVQAEFKFATD